MRAGNISNVLFQNINCASYSNDVWSPMGGISGAASVNGVSFNNCYFNGKLITNSATGHLSIGNYASHIKFNGVAPAYATSYTLTTSANLTPPLGDTNFYYLYNHWLTGQCLFDNGSGTVNYGNGSGYQYQWALRNVDGYIRFVNRGTGNIINIQTNNSYVQLGSESGWSADWFPIGTQGSYFQIRNRWRALQNLTLQNHYVESCAMTQVQVDDPAPTEWYLVNAVAPPAPKNLSAMAKNGQVKLLWEPVSGATSYNIYITAIRGGEVRGTPTYHGSNTPSNSIVTGLVDGATYFFQVSAVNSSGESANSPEVVATSNTFENRIK